MSGWRCLVGFGMVVACPALSVAQAPQPQAPRPSNYTVRVNSNLVVLDVVVTDKKGNLVTDLKKEDFTVTEAKEPQSILAFDAAGAHAVQPEVTIHSTAELDRLAPDAPVNIILLDEFNTRFEDMAFARYSLKKFLERQPEKLPTPTLLVAVSLTRFSVLHDYTQDKQAVIKALDHHLVAYPWQAHQASWIPERVETAFGTLRQVAAATAGHPGHKNMIWIGRGMPALDYTRLPIDSAEKVDTAVQLCVNGLRDARVTLYSIDPAGVVVDPSLYGQDAQTVDPFGGNYEFDRLAQATGGKALYGRNDVDAEIGTTVRDGTSFYTLTYKPSNETLDPQKFRRIKVTIDRPGLTASAREGYYQELPPAVVNPQSPSQLLAFDLTSAEKSKLVYDGVPLTVTPVEGVRGSYQIHVDAKALTWSEGTETVPRTTELVLVTAQFDRKGKEVYRAAQRIRVSAPKTAAPTGRLEESVNLKVRLQEHLDAVRARFVVRVSDTGRIGTADADLSGKLPTP